MSKAKTKKEELHMSSVAELGCIACAILGHHDSPAEIHHIKHQTGMGKRSTHFEVIPLCPLHHRLGSYAYHNSPKEFTGAFGTQKELLEMTLDWLAVEGCACGCAEERARARSPNPFDQKNIGLIE